VKLFWIVLKITLSAIACQMTNVYALKDFVTEFFLKPITLNSAGERLARSASFRFQYNHQKPLACLHVP
jgi:hypothetical protein